MTIESGTSLRKMQADHHCGRKTTDVSDFAIRVTAEQYTSNNRQPIGLLSRKLSTSETRYSFYDRELFAIFASIKFFKYMLKGYDIFIRLDHRPLVHTYA